MQIISRQVVNNRRNEEGDIVVDGILLDGDGNERLEKILSLRGRFDSTFTGLELASMSQGLLTSSIEWNSVMATSTSSLGCVDVGGCGVDREEMGCLSTFPQ
jgi:hypothetical protein